MEKYNNKRRFQLFKSKKHEPEYELMMESRAEFGEPAIGVAANSAGDAYTILENKIVVDSQEDKKFIITAECIVYEDTAAISPVKKMDSNYHVWEIKDDKAHLMSKEDAGAAININPDEIKGLKGLVVDPKKMNEAFLEVSKVISDKNIYSMMNVNSYRLAQEAGEFSTAAPDSRTKLKGHALLTEKLNAYKEQNVSAIKIATIDFKSRIDELHLNDIGDGSGLDDMQAEFDSVISHHRNNLMTASLAKSNFIVIDDKLMAGKEAEKFTEKNFSSVGRGNFMELGDIENRIMVGIADISTSDRISAELGSTPLDDKLIRLITLKEKGGGDQTNIYMVEDIDRHLWIRADQTNSQGVVISRNEESLISIGLNPDHITQGVSSENGVNTGEALEMRLQLSADHLRRLISNEQIKEHKASVTEFHVKPAPRPQPRVATTRIERHIDRNFIIERIDADETQEFSLWDTSTAIDDEYNTHVNSMWRVIDRRSGDIAIITDVGGGKDMDAEHQSTDRITLKYISKKGEPIDGNNWIRGFSINSEDGVNENSIKKGLERIDRFDIWDDPNLRSQMEVMAKGVYGLRKSRYPYYDDEDEDENEPIAYGKRRKNAVKH